MKMGMVILGLLIVMLVAGCSSAPDAGQQEDAVAAAQVPAPVIEGASAYLEYESNGLYAKELLTGLTYQGTNSILYTNKIPVDGKFAVQFKGIEFMEKDGKLNSMIYVTVMDEQGKTLLENKIPNPASKEDYYGKDRETFAGRIALSSPLTPGAKGTVVMTVEDSLTNKSLTVKFKFEMIE